MREAVLRIKDADCVYLPRSIDNLSPRPLLDELLRSYLVRVYHTIKVDIEKSLYFRFRDIHSSMDVEYPCVSDHYIQVTKTLDGCFY